MLDRVTCAPASRLGRVAVTLSRGLRILGGG
jgi:hypothetical protein